MKQIAFLDFETTGLTLDGEVIEVAIVLSEISETPEGEPCVGRVVEEYQAFQQPSAPIPPFITKLTGITDEMVKGQRIDWAKVVSLYNRADVMVAHGARFDRAWLEKAIAVGPKRWACSSSMVRWKEHHGMPCGHLKHLAWEHGYFPNAHRAMDDVKTLMTLLELPSRNDAKRTYFQELFSTVQERQQIVFATGSPMEKKDLLKQRGFRWSPQRRVWWKCVKESDLAEMSEFLTQQVYSGNPGFQLSDAIDPLDTKLEERFGLK